MFLGSPENKNPRTRKDGNGSGVANRISPTDQGVPLAKLMDTARRGGAGPLGVRYSCGLVTGRTTIVVTAIVGIAATAREVADALSIRQRITCFVVSIAHAFILLTHSRRSE